MVTFKSFALAAALACASGTYAGEIVLLDFNAPWCGPCRSMQPVVERLRAEGYPVREVNIDQNQQLANRFHVTSIPCFVVLADGREVNRTVGATTYERLRQMLLAAKPRTAPARPPAAGTAPPPLPRSPAPVPGPPTRRPVPIQPVASRQAPAGPAATQAVGSEAALLQSTVRIRVEDGTGRSFGTGTLIDRRGDQALVLTCGHLFRESQEDGKIFVELFLPGGVRTIPGHLVSYDLKRDIGLLTFRPGVPVRVARVAAKGHRIAPGDRVANVGCNNGQSPTVRQTHVTAIDRYDGPPNIEAAGTPIEGRSGGGLFDQHGHVIGVCFAADGSDNEGLYAGLESIHAELDRLGLASVYTPTAAAGQDAGTTLTETTPPPLPKRMADASVTPVAAVQSTAPAVPGQSAAGGPAARSPAARNARLSAGEQAALAEIGRRAGGAEVIFIVRPTDPKAKSEIFILDHVSPEFIRKLTDAGPSGTAQTAAPRTSPRLTSMSVPYRANRHDSVTLRHASDNSTGWRPKTR